MRAGYNLNQVAGDRSGLNLSSVINSSQISTATPFTFCLPVLSGVIGANASKMLPVGKLATPVVAQFYLSANDDAIYSGNAAAGTVWQLVNVELCLCYVEIQDDNFNHAINTSVPSNSHM